MMELHPNDRALLRALNEKEKDLEAAASDSGLGKDAAMRSAIVLTEAGLVRVREEKTAKLFLTEEGKRFLKELFPEQRVAQRARTRPLVSELSEEEQRIGVPWALRNGWVEVVGGKLMLKEAPEGYAVYDGLKAILEGKNVDKKTADVLCQRGNAEIKTTKRLFVAATKEGLTEAKKETPATEEIGELTPELLSSGKWKDAVFRKYNVNVKVERAEMGSVHPLVQYIQRIRRIFLNMGFQEMDGPEVESSFWNFDALFTPQDHPARELHDTFYLKKPGYIEYPKDIAEKVREAQEKGWGYKWDPTVAEQAVLRTHTTSVSARTLADIGRRKKKIGKYFCVGRVYRNEATDYKHLAEFYQVEGIVVWKHANFRQLLGCLQEFYKQLGFKKIKFVPHYFPYTEPSVEVHAYFEDRKEWVELAGAGIFRPELSYPLWGSYPVLAWGMGIERLPMLEMNLKDIRMFYQNDLDWLRGKR